MRRPSRHPCRYVNNYFPDPLLSDTEERNTLKGAQPFHCAYYIYRSYRKTLKKKKEKIKSETTNKSAKAEPAKTKGKQPVEKTKQTAVKDKKTVEKSKQSAVKESTKSEKVIAKKTPTVKTEVKKAEPKTVEKVTEKKVDAVAQKTASMVTKSVVVPRCNDSKVFAVLSDAFKKQGAATNTQMTVKQISQARETQSYPQQGIRSCNAIVETNGVKYVTDYSIILNDKGFFVQVENAQPAQRF